MSKILELIYLKKYNHKLLQNGFITIFYVMVLAIFEFILFQLVFYQPDEQKNYNLFIGLFTINSVLLSSLITILSHNSKRNKSIANEYHDVFEFLRNLNWYLQSGYARCQFLANEIRLPTQTEKESDIQLKQIHEEFNEMEIRIRDITNTSVSFSSILKNQIFITLDQSNKIFGSASYMKSPYVEMIISDVFIKTNKNVILNSFFRKYADEELSKVMGSCINWLILSVSDLDFISQNSK